VEIGVNWKRGIRRGENKEEGGRRRTRVVGEIQNHLNQNKEEGAWYRNVITGGAWGKKEGGGDAGSAIKIKNWAKGPCRRFGSVGHTRGEGYQNAG